MSRPLWMGGLLRHAAISEQSYTKNAGKHGEANQQSYTASNHTQRAIILKIREQSYTASKSVAPVLIQHEERQGNWKKAIYA